MILPNARAGNGIASELPSSAEGSASLAEERISHLLPKFQDQLIADRSTASAAPTIGEDPGALLIGGGIEFKGRIGSCNSLVVEGTIESTIECLSIEIRASGIVTGEAAVENAMIAGRFDGNLVVTGYLILRAGSRIAGPIRYGEIEIERGAKIAGDVAMIASEVQGVSASMAEYAVLPRNPTAEKFETRTKML